MVGKCPKELRWAVMHYAQSVKMVEELGRKGEDEPLCQYHYREFLDTMEQLLVQQVVTAFADESEMVAILSSTGLEHLIEDALSLARELGEADN